jgi:hypothetical protein
MNLPGERTISAGDTPVTETGTPIVEQAPWRIEVSRAGGDGRVTNAQKQAVARQEAGVTSLVQEVYDALLLERSKVDSVITERFIEGAGTAFVRATRGVLPAADELRLQKRIARIGIDVNGADRAAARVRIVVGARKGGTKALALNTSTLWLERDERGWQVIAYEIDQRPFEPKRSQDAKHGKAKKGAGKKGGNEK